MGSSLPARRRRSTTVKEQSFPISNFGKCAVALWPNKPALVLAQRVGVTERAANLWIAGRRKPSGRALLVLMDEID